MTCEQLQKKQTTQERDQVILFSGSETIFKLHPSQYIVKDRTILRVSVHERTVSALITFKGTDPKRFETEKRRILKQAFANADNANSDVQKWDSNLTNLIDQNFKRIKEAFLNENRFFNEIRLKI